MIPCIHVFYTCIKIRCISRYPTPGSLEGRVQPRFPGSGCALPCTGVAVRCYFLTPQKRAGCFIHARVSREALGAQQRCCSSPAPPGAAPRGMAPKALQILVSQCRSCGHETQLGGSTALRGSCSLSEALLESSRGVFFVPFVSFSVALKKRSCSVDP